MKIELAANIRSLRKSHSLTQEQLSEALGVTIGAVSKWESGLSVPDIGMIVTLANFFDTSVDVLLGYEWEQGSMGKTLEQLKELRRSKRFEEAFAAAELALKKYPNIFSLVYECAKIYQLGGIECDRRHHRRALALYERALELIGQNTDPAISELSLQMDMANMYICLEEAERGIEILKRTNSHGINDGVIGYTYAASLKDPKRALPYLSDAMLKLFFFDLMNICTGFLNAYEAQSRHREAAETLEFHLSVLDGLHLSKEVTYLDKIESMLNGYLACVSLECGDAVRAKEALRSAILKMRRFSAHPVSTMEGIRFFCGCGTERAYDSFPDTLAGLYDLVTVSEQTREAIKALWEEIVGEEI